MKKINCEMEIERLIKFALNKKIITIYDSIPARNALMDLLQVSEPYNGHIEEEKLEAPTEILNNILDYAAEKGIIQTDTTTYRDLMDAKIMGLLMPRQSEVIRNFIEAAEKYGIKAATDEFYNLSKASNYIRMDRIEKNLYWLSGTSYGDLEITVNLSKPEKDPRDIAAAKLLPQASYPKCLLCIENVGFSGNVNHPARQNHRVIPVTVNKEQWYLQYSPYVYYNEHCILFKGEHVPMRISDNTFKRLFDFVEQFPHYFIGSNADLPIVGGSILSHEHFQGGRHVFPMEVAPAEKRFFHREYTDVHAAIVRWPMSVVRFSSHNKEALIELSIHTLNEWRCYSDESVEIHAYSKNGEEMIPHNTITPIVRKNKAGQYEVDLVLRNNRTSKEHPEGIFHPHKELHHIKKENIGLIEVMGLAVLPARLETELDSIANILIGEDDIENINEQSELYKHKEWISELLSAHGTLLNKDSAKSILKQKIGEIFLQVLLDSGVYKKDEKGNEGFIRFIKHLGFLDS